MAGFITLVVSQTRSAIIGFLFGLVLVLFFSRHRVMAFLTLIVALLLPLTSVGDVLWIYFLRGQDPELFHSLSGRLTWWEFGWKKFWEQPWGYGAYAGGRFVVLENYGGGSNMHSSYLEIITGTGILGLLPVLIGLLGTWWVLIRERPNFSFGTLERGLAVEAIGVLGIITTRSFLSVKLVWHPALDFLLVLGYAELLRRRSKFAQLPGKLPS
jgi:O-antigen ligase